MSEQYITYKEFFEALDKMSDENKKDRHEHNNKIQELITRMEDKMDKHFETFTPIKETIAKHEEKLKANDLNMEEIKKIIYTLTNKIENINLKIAGVTGAWAVILFLIQYAISKFM